ncbi:MAG: radical SAM protein, partial [Cardiobacterium hominis]
MPANPGQCHRRAALLQSRRFFTPAIPMTRYFDAELIGKYSQSGPRYTSYPTAVEFHERFTAADYIRHLEAGNAAARDLSLYVHIPFCEHVCYYCGCNKIITRNHDQSDEYLDQLERDIARQAAHIDPSRRVIQLHLGGGTPTFLNHTQLRRLLAMLHEHFPRFAADDAGEYSIEIDPRTVSPDDLRFLRELGFNRVSFGVQDFDPAVQQAVNRIQGFEHVRDTIAAARDASYHSIYKVSYEQTSKNGWVKIRSTQLPK